MNFVTLIVIAVLPWESMGESSKHKVLELKLKLHRFPFMKLTIAMFLHALINNDTAVFSRKKLREGKLDRLLSS